MVTDGRDGVLDAAAGRLRELATPVTAGGEVVLHGDFYLGNILVYGGRVSALTDFEFSRMGPRDLELISFVRALDAESRLGPAAEPPQRLDRSPPRRPAG